MSDQGRMYDAPVVAAERDRLATFSYPNQVSCRVLDALEFSSLIDAGAGTGTSLAEYVIGRGATYTAFDFKPEMVAQMNEGLQAKDLPARAIEANILNISPMFNSADVVHERFVFMHLPTADQPDAMNNLLYIANRNIVLLEYNWRTMESSRHAEELERFRECAFPFMELLHIDPYAGETLQNLVRDMMPHGWYEFKRDQRPEGDYTSELITLCDVQSNIARRMGNADLAERSAKLKEAFSVSPIKFIPPEVVIAVVRA